MSAGNEIASVLLVTAVVAAAVYDIRYRLIPNRLAYSLMLAGTVLSIFDGRVYQSAGALGLCMILILPLYLAGMLGGGDFKLLLGISLFSDWPLMLESLLITVVLGAVMALVYLVLGAVRRGYPGAGQGDIPGDETSATQYAKPTIPLAVPIAGAVVCSHLLGIRLLV